MSRARASRGPRLVATTARGRQEDPVSGDEPGAPTVSLADARREQGLSVDEISRRTRLRPELVRDLEEGRWSALGPPVYARGHLRSVAAVLGVDPAPLLAEVDRVHGAPRPLTLRPRVDPAARAADRRPSGWVPVLVAAVLVVVGLGVVGVLVDDAPDGTATDGVAVAEPSVEAVEPTPAPRAAPLQPAPEPPPAEDDGVVLVVRTPERPSWARVSGPGGDVLFEGVVPAGDRQVFRAPEPLSVVLGDAGAVRLEVDGQDRGTPGDAGEVVRLELGGAEATG